MKTAPAGPQNFGPPPIPSSTTCWNAPGLITLCTAAGSEPSKLNCFACIFYILFFYHPIYVRPFIPPNQCMCTLYNVQLDVDIMERACVSVSKRTVGAVGVVAGNCRLSWTLRAVQCLVVTSFTLIIFKDVDTLLVDLVGRTYSSRVTFSRDHTLGRLNQGGAPFQGLPTTTADLGSFSFPGARSFMDCSANPNHILRTSLNARLIPSNSY